MYCMNNHMGKFVSTCDKIVHAPFKKIMKYDSFLVGNWCNHLDWTRSFCFQKDNCGDIMVKSFQKL